MNRYRTEKIKWLNITLNIKVDEYLVEAEKMYEEFLHVLDKLEKKLKEHPDICRKVQELKKVTVVLTAPPRCAINTWNRALRNARGVAYQDKNKIRLHSVNEEVVLEEVLHLAYPDKKEYEIADIVADILDILPRHVRIASSSVVAVDSPHVDTFHLGYLVPKRELNRLKRRRRSTRLCVTEDGDIVYLSSKQRDMYSMLWFLHSEYCPPEIRKELVNRATKAARQYLLKALDKKRGRELAPA